MQRKKQMPELFSHQPFRKLGDLLKVSEEPEQKPPSTRQASPEPESDDDLFKAAMKEVREIREFRNISIRRGKKSPPRKSGPGPDDTMLELEQIVQGRKPVRLADTQEYVEWVNPKYRREVLKELHGGRFAVQDYLDLHGHILEEAETALQNFIIESRRRGFNCIKIIHGRGLRSPDGPVLKYAVIELLLGRYRKYIIGFATARPVDGGLGALYVLLK
jgi:DNA-nicking Smr family endonuclease